MELKDLPMAITVLVLAGVFLGAGMIAFRGMQSSTAVASGLYYQAYTVNNASTLVLDHYPVVGFNAYNATSGELITGGNYTLYTETGRLLFGSNVYNGTDTQLNYTYETGTATKLILDNSTNALLNLSKQLPTVGTIIGIMVIIVAVLMMFSKIGAAPGR